MIESFKEAAALAGAFAADEGVARAVRAGARTLATCLKSGGKILVCGNGGSLADAVHFAEELTGRYRKDRPALAAIAIAEPGHLTCTANDYGFEQVFSRGVEALGRAGDCLVVLSTSGNSANVVLAVEAAKARAMNTIALLGKGGGKLAGACGVEIIAPGRTADRVQELHMLVLHTWVEMIEAELGYA